MRLLRSIIFKHISLAELERVQRLSATVQDEIAGKLAKFINAASPRSNQTTLQQYLIVAVQDRQDAVAVGASVADVCWAAAALSETWCVASLGKIRGTIRPADAAAVTQAIEQFALERAKPNSA